MGQYIGARYVPRFMDTYNVTQSYEALDVVDNGMGTSYIAKIPVPAGTPLTNTTYWAVYGASSGAIINLQNQIDAHTNEIADLNSKVVATYDNTAEMAAADLEVGDFCQTLGYYDLGDFGGCYYEIVSTAPATPYITLNNGNYAKALGLKYIEQIGAVHDGVTDVLSYINTFLTNGIDIELIAGCEYLISDAINMPLSRAFNGNRAILRSSTGKHFRLADGYSGNIIKNLILKGGAVGQYAILVTRPQCIFDNIEYGGESNFIDLEYDSLSGFSAYAITIRNCKYTTDPNTVADAARIAVKIDSNGGLYRIQDNNFSVCSKAINIVKAANVIIKNNNISECKNSIIPSQNCCAINIENGRNVVIDSNYIENANTAIIANGTTPEDIVLTNNFINLLDISSIVCSIQNAVNFLSEANYIKSTRTGAYAFALGANVANFTSINDDFVTDNGVGGVTSNAIIINNDVEFNNRAVNLSRRKVMDLTDITIVINKGGIYTNTSLSSGDTQTIGASFPTGSLFEFIAPVAMSLHFYCTNINTTISLTRGQVFRVIRLPDETYTILS